MGDSHIRNLFFATVNGLRGMESFAEGHPAGDVKSKGVIIAYEWRLMKDGTASDLVSMYENTVAVEPVPFDPCPCTKDVNRCLRIAMIWAPTFQEQLKSFDLAAKWNTSLLIVEPGNAYEHSNILSQDWASRIEQIMEHNANLHTGIVHWPWGNQPLTERRNTLLNWTKSGNYSHRMSYWTQDLLRSDDKQGEKTYHFACGLGRVNEINDQINAVEPCTDQTDTLQIRALVTLHFEAFINSDGD